jgi:hypothetical protein
MARALQDIITELNSVYNPQRDVYNQQLGTLDPQLEAEQQGLQAQKQDSFQQITDQANRRGMFYSGLPIAEEQKYVGQQYLPAIANLRGKYANQRFGLQETLAKLTSDQYNQASGLRQGELDREEAQRQFDAQLAAKAAADRAAGASGASPTYQPTITPAPKVLGAQTTLRQQWQKEANAGDWNAQVALNYAGDNGRYDGPVNSQDEYNRLKSMGITGNYYVRGGSGSGGGGGGW